MSKPTPTDPSFAERVADASHRVADRAEEAAHRTIRGAEGGVNRAAEQAESLGRHAKAQGHRLAETVGDAARSACQRTSHRVQQRPWAALGVAAGLGAAVAWLCRGRHSD